MKNLFVLFLSVCTLSATAQKNDPAAKSLLDKVSQNFKSLKSVVANYSLTVTNRAGKTAGQKSGEIYLKGTKYKITESSMEIMSDGKTQWRFEPDANEVTVSRVDNNADGITPQKLFTNFYDKDFLYKLNGTSKIGGATVKEIELTPTDKRKSFFKVYVYVDEAKKMIVSSKIFETSGNVYNYTMTNLKTNQTLSDGMFVFDKTKHPGVDVIQQ